MIAETLSRTQGRRNGLSLSLLHTSPCLQVRFACLLLALGIHTDRDDFGFSCGCWLVQHGVPYYDSRVAMHATSGDCGAQSLCSRYYISLAFALRTASSDGQQDLALSLFSLLPSARNSAGNLYMCARLRGSCSCRSPSPCKCIDTSVTSHPCSTDNIQVQEYPNRSRPSCSSRRVRVNRVDYGGRYDRRYLDAA